MNIPKKTQPVRKRVARALFNQVAMNHRQILEIVSKDIQSADVICNAINGMEAEGQILLNADMSYRLSFDVRAWMADIIESESNKPKQKQQIVPPREHNVYNREADLSKLYSRGLLERLRPLSADKVPASNVSHAYDY